MKKPVGSFSFAGICAIISAIVIIFLIHSKNLTTKIESLESEIELLEQECANEYDYGYRRGYENGVQESYIEIHDMETNEILEYLENYYGEDFWPLSEVHNAMVYAFQRGYENHKNSVWDEMTEEYIDGYEFHRSDIAHYNFFEW